MAKNTNRLGRVNEELKKEISQVINYELKNPDVTGMISVTKVKVTPDLKYAKVYVSILNPKNLSKTLSGLKESAGFIRSRVAQTVNLRITPELVFEYDDSIEYGETELVFEYDDSIEYGEKIDAILRELKKDEK